MATQEILLGFDIREMWFGMNNWSQQMRDQQLIRHQIEKPLTVDADIWLSVFDIHPLPMVPEWHETVQFLWKDFAEMNSYFIKLPVLLQPSWTIAVTLRLDLLTDHEKAAWGRDVLDFASFSHSDYEAKFIGYDVADRFLTSGLLSFGLPASEAPSFEEKWAEHLDKHHLFRDYAFANEYRHSANQKFEQHAPFFVYGLYSMSLNGERQA